MKKDLKYSRTKKGLVTKIFALQKSHSKKRQHDLPNYTKDDLKEWLYSQSVFHLLYENWILSNYHKNLIPSCDRKDDSKPYTLNNLQIITWIENKLKAEHDMRDGKLSNWRTPHKGIIQRQKNGDFIQFFVSAYEAQRQLGISQGNISKVCNNKQKFAGGFVWEFIPDGMRYNKELDKLVPDIAYKNGFNSKLAEAFFLKIVSVDKLQEALYKHIKIQQESTSKRQNEMKTKVQQLIHATDKFCDTSFSVEQEWAKKNVADEYIKDIDLKNHRSYNIGSSNYSKLNIQPWDIWKDWNLDPWDADIIKRISRTKEVLGKTFKESRIEDYEKIKHICDEKISQLQVDKNVK